MKKTLITFSAGAALGSALTYYFVKDYYREIADEEINSVREVFDKPVKKNESNIVPIMREKPPIEDIYTQYIKETTNYSNMAAENEHPEEDESEEIDTISPGKFAEFNSYAKETLLYYAEDDILVRTATEEGQDEIVDDIENTIGLDALNNFGEFEDGVVYVRNSKISTDFEVILQEGKYYEGE